MASVTMRKSIFILILYYIQCYAVVKGGIEFGRNYNPFLLLAIGLLIPICFLYKYSPSEPVNFSKRSNGWIGFILGALCFCIISPQIRTLFAEFPNPGSQSDVLPQLDALYIRCMHGEQPYYPLPQYDWHPFPVYMPMHWLPLAIPYLLKIDIRWVGLLFLAIANGAWGNYIWKRDVKLFIKIVATVLPVTALLTYINYARMDIAVSLETVIAAYYLVLAVGLASRNLWLTTAGIILCLLSRYTMIFWLPLFALLLWANKPAKASFIVWGSVIAAVFFIYLLPFYFRDPTILSQGVSYHNHCAIEEWKGFVDPDNPGTFEAGLYFAPYILKLTSGPMEQRVTIARGIQAVLMLTLLAGGFFYYRKRRAFLNFYDFSLVMLYLFVFVFYTFSPLLFKYYYIVIFCLSSIICGKVLMRKRGGDIYRINS